MSRKRSWSARAEVPLLPVAKQRLDDIAAMFAEEEVKEFLIVMDLKRLSRDYGQFEKWRHPSTDLNLLQFAVLRRRSEVVKYLLDEHRKLLEFRLYVHLTFRQERTYQLHDSLHHASNRRLPPMSVINKTCCSQLKRKLVNHPLHMACWLGDLDCLKALTKVDLQAWESKAVAAKYDLTVWMETVSVITSTISAPLQSEPVEGQPLDLASKSGSISCLTFLLGDTLPVLEPNGLLPKKVEGRELTLHAACCLGCPQLVATILAARPRDVHSRDGEGRTPLHFAVQRGQTDTIRLLLEHEADVNAWTPIHSTCLHFLFRYGEPHTLVANTKLLVEHGAMLNLTESVVDWVWVGESPQGNGPVLGNRTVTPLHVLVDRIMWSPRSRRLRLMHMKPARKLIGYTQSDMEESPDWYTEDTKEGCMQEVVSCLRLILEHRADPNATSDGQNTLQAVMCHHFLVGMLSTEYPELLFTVVSTLLEFGATIARQNDFGSLRHFLGCHVCAMKSNAVQASFIRLFCENGIDPDDMARHLVNPLHRDSHLWKWSLPFWTCLANRMSVGALSITLPAIHHPQFTNPKDLKTDLNQVRSSLYGSPVRSLRHSCKVAVWKALGHQGGRVASLPVPDKVKAYLKSDDL